MPATIVGRHHLAVIAAGYAGGIAALPWLFGPLSAPERSLVVPIAVALLMPTAALVACSSVDMVFRRTSPAAPHVASIQAVSVVMLWVALFMSALHGLMLVSLLGVPLSSSPHRLVVVMTGILCIGVGNVLPRVRPNMAIGIRTRRLLENPVAWARVHRLAGYSLVALGMATTGAGWFLSKQQIPVVLSVTLVAAAATIVNAYRTWSRG